MPEVPEDLFSPIKRTPSKPYRNHPTITVRDVKEMPHAAVMALDRELDARNHLQHHHAPGNGLGQSYAVGHRPEQTGNR